MVRMPRWFVLDPLFACNIKPKKHVGIKIGVLKLLLKIKDLFYIFYVLHSVVHMNYGLLCRHITRSVLLWLYREKKEKRGSLEGERKRTQPAGNTKIE